MSEKFMCVCGKKREQLHITNWNKHLDNCKTRKTKISCRPISSFFPGPKKVRMNTKSNYSCSNELLIMLMWMDIVRANQTTMPRLPISNTNCVVYDLFINPCPEALYNQPCQLPQTVNASIAFKYKPKFGSNSPQTRLYAETFLLDLPFLDMDTNACVYTNCPVVKDAEQNWLYNLYVSKNYPRTSYTVKFKFWDTEPNAHSDQPQCCFKFDIKIV